jgi:hypothetical protein
MVLHIFPFAKSFGTFCRCTSFGLDVDHGVAGAVGKGVKSKRQPLFCRLLIVPDYGRYGFHNALHMLGRRLFLRQQ